MKLLRITAAVVALGLLSGGAAAQQGQTLAEGETVIAANVKTGAQFLAIVRGDARAIFYVAPDGRRVPMTAMTPISGGQCSPGWALECHQDFSELKRICFCVAGKPASGVMTIDTTTGEVLW